MIYDFYLNLVFFLSARWDVPHLFGYFVKIISYSLNFMIISYSLNFQNAPHVSRVVWCVVRRVANVFVLL